jgi:hypothetical protein
LSYIVIKGKLGPLKGFSVLLGEEETPLQNIFGIMMKYFSGFMGKLLPIRYPCSRCVPAYLVGNKITFDLSEFSFPNAK